MILMKSVTFTEEKASDCPVYVASFRSEKNTIASSHTMCLPKSRTMSVAIIYIIYFWGSYLRKVLMADIYYVSIRTSIRF